MNLAATPTDSSTWPPVLRLVAITIAVAGFGCGSDSGDGNGADGGGLALCDSTERYMSLETGKSWTFDVTDVAAGTVMPKTQTIGPLEDVGDMKAGLQAFRVTTMKTGGMVTSWQQDTGTSILRHRERDEAGGTQSDEFYDPYKLRVDEDPGRIVVGAEFTENYSEIVTDLATNMTATTAKTEVWTIQADDDIVTVPAGTFCSMRIRRTSMAVTGGSMKTYWFARGVGKIKEDNGARREELRSFVVP